jgi:hypothetical protein
MARENKRPKRSLASIYHIVSHDSLVENFFADAAGKKKGAAQKLLNAIIPDIEKWVVAN